MSGKHELEFVVLSGHNQLQQHDTMTVYTHAPKSVQVKAQNVDKCVSSPNQISFLICKLNLGWIRTLTLLVNPILTDDWCVPM